MELQPTTGCASVCSCYIYLFQLLRNPNIIAYPFALGEVFQIITFGPSLRKTTEFVEILTIT